LAPLSESAGPGPFLTLSLESLRLFAPLAEELLAETGMDILYRPTGLLRVALTEDEERTMRRRAAWQVEAALSPTWLDPDRARDLEPALTRSARGVLSYPQEHQVSGPALVRALLRAATDRGLTLREGVDVTGLQTEADRVIGVRTAGETLLTDAVILAGGAWSGAWSASLRFELPVRPVRGQMVALRTAGTALRRILYTHGGYLVSKPDGLTCVGATQEEVGFDSRPTAAGVADLLALVPRLAPGLADATFSHAWAGLRPATPDRMPIIGRVPGWQNVLVATGHFRNGVLLAPITGELIADLVRTGRPRMSLEAFDPGRFTVRAA